MYLKTKVLVVSAHASVSLFKVGDKTSSAAPPASPIVSNCPNSSV